MAKHQKAIHHHVSVRIRDGKFVNETNPREVLVMAVSGKWAMVRVPRCLPYVCREMELTYR